MHINTEKFTEENKQNVNLLNNYGYKSSVNIPKTYKAYFCLHHIHHVFVSCFLPCRCLGTCYGRDLLLFY